MQSTNCPPRFLEDDPKSPVGNRALLTLFGRAKHVFGCGVLALVSLLVVSVHGKGQTQAAAVSGRVVDGISGGAVGGAAVLIVNQSSPRDSRRTQTDPDGRFAFTDLQRGSYLVYASQAGYLDSPFGGRSLVGSTAAAIALRQGEWFKETLIVLVPQAEIQGVVKKEEGQPVVGARVRAFRRSRIDGEDRLEAVATGKTDDRGLFTIGGLVAGHYVVMVPSVQDWPISEISSSDRSVLPARSRPDTSETDRRLFVYQPTYAPSSSSLAQARDVNVDAGNRITGVDVLLRPVRGVRVSGVTSDHGMATSGGRVRLWSLDAKVLGASAETATALVDANGRFEFGAVPSGRYLIGMADIVGEYGLQTRIVPVLSDADWAKPPGSPGLRVDHALVRLHAGVDLRTYQTFGPDVWGTQFLDVNGADSIAIQLGVTRMSVLTGTVNLDPIAVRVEQPQPMPRLLLRPEGFDLNIGLIASSSVTPPRGTSPAATVFRFDKLPPGSYRLSTEQSQAWILRSFVINGVDHLRRAIVVPAGGPPLSAVATFTNRPAYIQGRVPGPFMIGTRILIVGAEASRSGLLDLQRDVEICVPSTSGEFRSAPLLAGAYLVVAVRTDDRDDYLTPEYVRRVTGTASLISVDWGDVRQVAVTVAEAK